MISGPPLALRSRTEFTRSPSNSCELFQVGRMVCEATYFFAAFIPCATFGICCAATGVGYWLFSDAAGSAGARIVVLHGDPHCGRRRIVMRQPNMASSTRAVGLLLGVDAVSGLTRDILDRARRSRDARFDGRFFIAVRSTRIYCRPICPSRFSHDSNIRYYATAEEAAEAGYRPCLRCRPEAAPGSPAWTGTSAVVQRALRLIQDGALDHGSVGDLANRLGIGVRHLSRLFAQHVGASPATVAQTRRLQFAKRLLDDTHLPITDIALASGFGSIRRFNDVFLATYRRSPSELRKGRRGGFETSKVAEITLRLAYRPPYDWDHIRGFLARAAIPGVEVVAPGSYARAVWTPSGHALLQIRPVPRAHALEVRVQGAMPAELPRLLSSVRRMFDLTADPAHINSTLRSDPLLRPLIARRPGLRIPGAWDPFECTVGAMVAQQPPGQLGRPFYLSSLDIRRVRFRVINPSLGIPIPGASVSLLDSSDQAVRTRRRTVG